MRPIRGFRFPWRSRHQIARDVDTELAFHLDMRVGELMRSGQSRGDAEAAARREFGDLEFTRNYCRTQDEQEERTMRWTDRFESFRYDLRHAARSLSRTRAFTAVAVLTIALVLGANTAVFSAARTVLLRPLPYYDPNALLAIWEKSMGGNFVGTTPLSPPNYTDLRAQQHTFTDIAVYSDAQTTWIPTHGDPELLRASMVSGNLFTVLQATPRAGRTLRPDDALPTAPDVAVISSRLFDQALAGNPARIGESLVLNGKPTRVVGVMRPDFVFGYQSDLWFPLDLTGDLADPGRTRKQHWLHGIGRLRPGVTGAAAARDLTLIWKRLITAYPEADSNRVIESTSYHSWLIGPLGSSLALLQGAAFMVLLIACANVANLTLSRVLDRRRDIAVRAALGSGRRRLMRQAVMESLLVAALGGLIGVVLAYLATRSLLALDPNAVPGPFAVTVDPAVFGFGALLALVTGLLAAVAPAIAIARVDLQQTLRQGDRGSSGGQGLERARRALVVAQVAIAVALMIGAGLLVRSFRALDAVKLGFASDHVLTAELSVRGDQYDASAAVNQFYDKALGDIAQLPGVVAVGAADNLPTQGEVGTGMRIDGQPNDESNLPDMGYIAVRGDYFQALHVPLLAGRLFQRSDDTTAPSVAVINETALHKYFPNGAVGRTIHIGPTATGAPITIVGVVGDMHGGGPGDPVRPTLFPYHRQQAWQTSLALAVRTRGDPNAIAAGLRRAVHAADPDVAIHDIATLDAVTGRALSQRRFALALVTGFAVLAFVLATIGIYGVLAYLVAARRREFGVRLALGATPRSVIALVMRQGLVWVGAGLLIGAGATMVGRQLLAASLYGITAADPVTLVGVSAALLAVAGVACLIPALRATRVDPLTSMRAE